MAAGEASSNGGGSGSGTWTREQDKAFEDALATLGEPDDEAAVWDWIALAVEGKTAAEVRRHYELLAEDVDDIEAGRVPLLAYAHDRREVGGGKKTPSKKAVTWTLDEHMLFLEGLDKHGKGDWKSISRNFVISRTPSQVASHAQKFYNRQNSQNTERRRPSILDITSVNNGESSAALGPITGTNGQAALPGKSPKQPTQPANLPPGVDAFGTTIGQPFGGPLVSAVGTPVTCRVPAPPHMAYGMHAPVPGTVVPRAPINIPYPMPPPSSR